MSNEERELVSGGQYKHFKGGVYEVGGLARHTETNEDLVIYQCISSPVPDRVGKISARPVKMFLSKVDREKYPDVEQEYRFELIEKGK